MLTKEIKRKIDAARNVLVGKVPDPKAQVEQITTALIYKFMDDMDKSAEELGGKARFFTNGYEKYSWTKMLDSRLGGQDRLNLYVEAIAQLSQNPHIPQLFRDIFKDTFLPYRNPETLSLFLKEVNGFAYDHSEDLGDAFEYLLSILGSQGEAGQFRTPRHIIDFIVEAVEPAKSVAICDPACGTAGFLISAYKYIVRHNSSNLDQDRYIPSFARHFGNADSVEIQPDGMYKGDMLTPDEKKKLMDHFIGYDISPDMVRISKVNMYLHNFSNPIVNEYDTLSSEERWDEMFDVILANPPFMTPKGGIKPHKRFAIQANRAEVLFVDYIVSHLRKNGRAGIIVPEGIIFKAEKAYKKLRKLLIDDGLFAVVSLPSGVFRPYAGAKTNILLLDKELANKSKDLLFIKVQNDGYDLGDQRGEIEKNDLPDALRFIKKYKNSLREGSLFTLDNKSECLGHLVSREKILEDENYNLTGDRYKETVASVNRKWPMVSLGDIAKLVRGPFGGSLKKEIFKSSGYLVYEQYHAINGDFDFGRYFIDENKFNEMKRFEVFYGDLLVSCSGTMGKVAIVPKNCKKGIINQALLKLTPDKEKINIKYLKSILETDYIQNKYFKNQSGSSIQNVASVKTLKKMQIPLPPLKIQEEIMSQLKIKDQEIYLAKKLIQNLENEKDALLMTYLEN